LFFLFAEHVPDWLILALLATMAPHRDDLALNKGEFERVLNGERTTPIFLPSISA
jgi:hypothetical protein